MTQPPRTFRTTIPSGTDGTLATLRAMAGVVRLGFPQHDVSALAHAIVLSRYTRDLRGQIEALRDALRESFRFVRDPLTTETLRAPEILARAMRDTGRVSGDCDDAAILGAALGLVIGARAFLTAVAFSKPTAPYTHVYCLLTDATGRYKLNLDVTKPDGVLLPVTRKISVEV